MEHRVEGDPVAPRLSIVIPTLDEERTLPFLLHDLRALPVAHEVIVADGGSADATRRVAAESGATVLAAKRGRGAQLIAGARAARAPVLFFVHADARLDAAAVDALVAAVREASVRPAVFRLRVDARGVVYRLIELMANDVRTRLMRLPYGDQGVVVARAMYDAVGGYRDMPLMEDVELVRALRRRARIRLLPAALLVSARRWERDGPWRRTFRNWGLMVAYGLGMSAERLAGRYRR